MEETKSPIAQAKSYIERGFSVIPVLPREKRSILRGWEQFSTRQPTQEELESWFQNKTWEETNLAIVAGLSVKILDIDDGTLWAFFFDESPESMDGVVRSGSIEGQKFHVYLRCEAAIENTELKGVVELKTEGRYCVAPSSIHPSGQKYEWLSEKRPKPVSKLECERIQKKIEFLKNHYENLKELTASWKPGLDIAHNLHLHLAGLLMKNKVKEVEVKRLCSLLVLLSRDRELEDRLKCVETTFEQKDWNEVAGYQSLSEDLNQIFGGDSKKSQEFISNLLKGFGIKQSAHDLKDVSELPKVPLSSLLKFWHDNFNIEDDAPLLITLATAATNSIDGDPVWLLLVGPPSSIKSETIRAFGSEPSTKTCPISSLTANTFLSGMGKEGSLLPRIDGKILTIKDFTTILQKNKDSRDEILSQLREIYDGYLSKATGNEDASYQNVRCKITVIGGVTPVIDIYDSVQGLLGDRFLKVRVSSGDSKQIAERAVETTAKESGIRKELFELTMGFMNDVKPTRLELSEENKEKLLELVIFTAKARTPIARDWRGVIQYLPEPEGIARLFKQFLKLAWGLAAVLGTQEIDDVIVALLARVALDTVDQRRVKVMQELSTLELATKTSTIASILQLPTETTKRVLEELHILDLVEKVVPLDDKGNPNPSAGYLWKLTTQKTIVPMKYFLPEGIIRKSSCMVHTHTNAKLLLDFENQPSEQKISLDALPSVHTNQDEFDKALSILTSVHTNKDDSRSHPKNNQLFGKSFVCEGSRHQDCGGVKCGCNCHRSKSGVET